MNQTAALAEVSKFHQLIFIDHIETAGCTYRQHDTQIEQIVFLKFNDRIGVDACSHLLLLVHTVILINQVAEFVF